MFGCWSVDGVLDGEDLAEGEDECGVGALVVSVEAEVFGVETPPVSFSLHSIVLREYVSE